MCEYSTGQGQEEGSEGHESPGGDKVLVIPVMRRAVSASGAKAQGRVMNEEMRLCSRGSAGKGHLARRHSEV